MRSAEQIKQVMDVLTQMPAGGIGPDGATAGEIEQAEDEGRCVYDDAGYHVAQKAWLMLEAIRDIELGRL